MPSPSQHSYEAVPLRSVDYVTVRGDPYAYDLGAGVPVYNAWAIEDDKSSAAFACDGTAKGVKVLGDSEKSHKQQQQPHYSNCYGGGRHSPRHSFHTPGGQPSSNELWRFRVRGCQDCWAALFFIALVVVVLLWGVAQVTQLELSPEDLAVIAGEREVNPAHTMPPRGKNSDALRNVAAMRAGMAALWERQNSLFHPPAEVSDAPTPDDNNDKKKDDDDDAPPAPSSSSPRPPRHLSIVTVLWFAVSIAFGLTTTLLVAYGGLIIIAMFPRQLIIMQAVACSMFFALSAGVSLARGSPSTALISTVLTVMPLLWIYLIQDRIPFTATMLCATVTVLRRHKSLFVITFSSVVACWLALVVFAFCVMPSALRLAAGWVTTKDVVYPFIVVFAFFWVQEVLGALVHVTVCGVVATWYFAGEEFMPPSPVKMSFHRATTTSLGSVCFGSLITAIVSFIHFLIDCVRSGNDQDSFVMCLMDCLVGCIEDLVRYFNQYAFVHVAIYGCSYIDAAKETWVLVKQCVFSAVFNDCLANQVVAIMTLMSAGFVAVLTGIVTWSLLAVVVMFMMTWVVCSIFYSPIASCVTTIFVCFAEVPVGLQLSFPELYDALVDADAGYTQRRGEPTNSYGTYMI